MTLAPRTPLPDAVGTHVPILVGLAYLLKPRRVLELGVGLHSTPLFLNRDIFSSVAYLESLENDKTWADRMRTDDPRHNLITVNGTIDVAIDRDALSDFDLIFVDDSTSDIDRASTIVSVSRTFTPVVIHDFEEMAYRKASLAFEHRFTFDCYNPATGICWTGDRALRGPLQDLRRKIRDWRDFPIAITDAWAWSAAIGARG